MEFISTLDALRKVYKAPGELPVKKELSTLDKHSRDFIAKSPFLVIASQSASGLGDTSPKGDLPGFVHVLDDRTIAIPDRPGNNRLDTLENIIENPAIGILFLIPGMSETLRINGNARITVDEELCAQLSAHGKPAVSALVVDVEQVYVHCAKAFIRSGLWKPETWMERSEMPTLGQMLRDQIALQESAQSLDAHIDKSYREKLW